MLYRFLHANPAIRLLLPLVVGIFVAGFIEVKADYLLLFLFLGFLFLLLVPSRKIRHALLKGLFISLFFLVLGIFVVMRQKQQHTSLEGLQKHYVKAVLLGEVSGKGTQVAIPLRIVELQKEGKLLPTDFKTMVYFTKDSVVCEKWAYGDALWLELRFFPLKKNTNPYVFDYSKLLKQRQFYCMAKGDLKKVIWMPSTRFSLVRYARFAQRSLSALLDSYIPNKNASGFLQAMTLGDKASLATEVREDFAEAGVVHVLAVSGLHVGILFLLINLILRPLRITRKGRITLVGIGILVIWIFAFISGLSASVLRSAIMFSLLQLGIVSLRPYRIYNTLAMSAFIMLLINPLYLYELGFQLSYLAVLSIVILVPIWDKRRVGNGLFDKLKGLLFVSLAAQLGVAPLVLYHFHHLPTYFLLGNLIVLLLAPLLLGGSLLILIFSVVPFLAKWLGILLSFLTESCLYLVKCIAKLPNASWIDYSLDFSQMLLLYALLLTLLVYSFKRKGRYFVAFLSCMLFFVVYTELKNFEQRHQQILVVHELKGASCYSVLDGEKAVALYSSSLQRDLSYTLEPLWRARGIQDSGHYTFEDSNIVDLGNCMLKEGQAWVANKHIVFCPKQLKSTDSCIAIDILVLAKNSNWKAALTTYEFKQIVLDSSFKKRQSQKLKKELLALGFSVHSVLTDGTFILD